MLDIKFIRENPDVIKQSVAKRHGNVDVDYLLEVDEKRRAKIVEVESMRKEHNLMSERIPQIQGDDKKSAIGSSKDLKAKIVSAEFELAAVEEEFLALMYKLPNVPDGDVPLGKDDTENVVLQEKGQKPDFGFKAKDYVDIGEKLDLIDTERAAKVSGARFGYLKREAALLEFALVQLVLSRLSNEEWIRSVVENYNLDVAVKAFIPLVPPVMIRPEVFRAMGKLDPGQEDERYFLPKDNLYLIGSAEHTTGAMYMNETLDEEQLPHRHIAFSTCFRREAGSYGKDTRGILRVHQFDKLEMFSVAHPETSKQEHEFFCAIQQSLMDELRIPYRVMLICTGDMVWTDSKQFDIETWLPGQNDGKGEYRETHSTSNTRDFQARRLNAKFRDKEGNSHIANTFNGTAFAIGRIIIGILENYQQEDGSVRVHDVLQSFMGGMKEIRR